ncbi:MAG: GAF domain-containing protein [Thiobacillus sp.]|nr:GAF domain-containing protein [Thiobacillus sp.]
MDAILSRLQQLSTTLEQATNLEASLKQSVAMAAALLNVNNSVIALLGEAEPGEPGEAMLKVFAIGADHSVSVSSEPLNQHVHVLEQVTAAGAACLIDKLSKASLRRIGHRQPNACNSLLAAPILINNKVVGILSASGHKLNRPLEQSDLEWIGMIGLLVGKSMQVVQLQNVLSSRFAQLALVREAKANLGVALEKAVENPDQLARILAKSFFREMTTTGFSTSQIIQASSEIIAQLSSSLNRHSKRLEKPKGKGA